MKFFSILSEDLRKKYGKRAVGPRKGDSVKICGENSRGSRERCHGLMRARASSISRESTGRRSREARPCCD